MDILQTGYAPYKGESLIPMTIHAPQLEQSTCRF